MTFGQFVSARDNHSVDDDAKMFFALGNAVFDAGIATWEAKVNYDYVRPVRAIRELGELGLIGEFDAAIDKAGWTTDDGARVTVTAKVYRGKERQRCHGEHDTVHRTRRHRRRER